MDQINPLAEMTHKRRLSALGPGGLSRDRAGFEVRDVHYTHYGRLCPSRRRKPEYRSYLLALRLCEDKRHGIHRDALPPRGKRQSGVDMKRRGHRLHERRRGGGNLIIAQATAGIDEEGNFLEPDRIKARVEADYPTVNAQQVNLVDVAPNQIASIAASLIRSSNTTMPTVLSWARNMMRQAVPLINPPKPPSWARVSNRR